MLETMNIHLKASPSYPSH